MQSENALEPQQFSHEVKDLPLYTIRMSACIERQTGSLPVYTLTWSQQCPIPTIYSVGREMLSPAESHESWTESPWSFSHSQNCNLFGLLASGMSQKMINSLFEKNWQADVPEGWFCSSGPSSGRNVLSLTQLTLSLWVTKCFSHWKHYVQKLHFSQCYTWCCTWKTLNEM